jgi:tetratricopeptide (TPR) repeat protein
VADTRIDELRRRLERDPGSRLFAQLAEELRKNGELAEAIRVARAGLAVHAAYPSARLTLGRALLDSGDATGARAELDSAARDAPDNIQASRYLALAREQLGDLKGAAEQYRKTLLMAPDDRQLQGALAAVDARLHAPGDESAALAAQTTPPATRHAPPPLPAGGVSTPAPSSAAPPVVVAPARPTAPAEPERDASVEGGALPPTLRIHASQTGTPPPHPPHPPRPRVSAPAPPEPPGALDAVEPKTLPGASGTQALGERAGKPPSRPAAALEAQAASRGPAGDGPSASTTPFSSSTLAELYFQQGLVDRAVDVYRQLLEQEPDNEKARERLTELEHAAPVADDRTARRHALERTIAGLTALLGAVRRR